MITKENWFVASPHTKAYINKYCNPIVDTIVRVILLVVQIIVIVYSGVNSFSALTNVILVLMHMGLSRKSRRTNMLAHKKYLVTDKGFAVIGGQLIGTRILVWNGAKLDKFNVKEENYRKTKLYTVTYGDKNDEYPYNREFLIELITKEELDCLMEYIKNNCIRDEVEALEERDAAAKAFSEQFRQFLEQVFDCDVTVNIDLITKD